MLCNTVPHGHTTECQRVASTWYCSLVTANGNQNFQLLVKNHGQDIKTESYLHRLNNLAEYNYGTCICQDATTLDIFQETFQQNVKFK